jgi:hypothetical protein
MLNTFEKIHKNGLIYKNLYFARGALQRKSLPIGEAFKKGR